MPTTLYDKSGKPVQIDDDKVADAFASGNYGLPAGQVVPVRLKDGSVGTLPSEHLQDALSKGAKIATPKELEQAEADKAYGGLTGGVEAALAGGARGLTVGLSDVAASEIGGEGTAKALRQMQEAHPYVSGASELAGTVAPLLATGGASAAAEGAEGLSAGAQALRGAGTVSRGVAGAGELAERGAAHVLGEGAAGIRGVAQRVVPTAIKTGVESGLYSGGDELSRQALEHNEDDLGDPETNGQKLFAAVGHGFLLGSSGGALLSGTGEIGREVLGRAAPHLAGAAEEQAWRSISGRKAFEKEAEKIPGGTRAIGRDLLDEGIISAGDRIEDIAPKVNEARKAQGAKIGDLLDSADANGIDGPKVSDILGRVRRDVLPDLKKLGNTNAGAIAKVQGILDDLQAFAEERSPYKAPGDVFKIGVADSSTPYVTNGTKAIEIRGRNEPFTIDPDAGLGDAGEAGWRIGKDGKPVLHPGDAQSPIKIDMTRPGHIGEGVGIDPGMTEGADIGPGGIGNRKAYEPGIKPGAFTDDASAIKKPFKVGLDTEATEAGEAAARGAYDRDLRMTFRQAQDFRSRVDDLIKWTTNPLAPVNETTDALKGIRNAIESSIVDAGDKAAPELGGTWRESYDAAKLRYRRLIVADKAAADTVERFGANASHSLTDKLMGSQGLNAGLLHGFGEGHGLAGLASGGLHGLGLGMLTGAASKIARTRGNSTLAVIADKLSALGGIQRAVNSVDSQIERGVANAIDPGSRIAPKVREPAFDHADPNVRFRKRVDAVSQAAGQPDQHADKLADAVAGLEPHAPKTSNAFQRAAIRATAFLASKLPAQPPHNPLNPHEREPRVSDTQRAQYDRLVNIVHDPVGATFNQIHQGTLTSAEVDALRQTHPNIYGQIVKLTHVALSKATHPIPFEKRIPLALLLGIPVIDPILSQALQGAGGGGKAPAPSGPPHGAPKRMLKGIAQNAALTGSKAGSG